MRRNILLVMVFVGVQLFCLGATSQDTDLRTLSDRIRTKLFGKQATFKQCLTMSSSQAWSAAYHEVSPIKRPLWTVAILYEEMVNGELIHTHHCMGVLINLKVVLSAAHCVFNKTITQIKVRSNECHNRDRKSFQESHIEKFIIHGSFNLTYPQHDIALLVLQKSFRKSACVDVACLSPVNSWPSAARVNCFTNGWISPELRNSKLQSTNGDGSTLMQLEMQVSPASNCAHVMRKAFGPEFKLSDSFICAQGPANRDLFQATGGAPLYCKLCKMNAFIVIGIMSWGFNTTVLPEVFNSIDKNKFWIRSTLKKLHFEYPTCKIK